MSKFLNEKFKDFQEYTPGEQPKAGEYIKLNTNESPYPPGPLTWAKACDPENAKRLRLYPDPDLRALKQALAKRYGVEPTNVFCANGSDDILYVSFMAFGQDGLVFPDITYGFYDVFAGFIGQPFETKKLKDDFTIDVNDYLNTGKMVVIADPNAPTGLELLNSDIRKIIESNSDHVVLIDQAYADFGGTSYIPLTKEYDNLIVCCTYSKSRSLAGARLGFAVASEGLIKDLEKLKFSMNPYSVNRTTAEIGITALEEDDYYMENCKKIAETREWTTEELKKLGFYVIPSKTNFIFASSPDISGESLYTQLKDRKILVRHFDNERISNYNRITIGKREDMSIFIDTVKEILGKQGE